MINLSIEKTKKIKSYNLKIVKYHDKEEYRFYSTPITATEGSSSDKTRYIIKDGKEVNAITGIERSKESIEHSINSSLKRTRQKIYDYIQANEWSSNSYFLTITFDTTYVDSFNYDECYKRIRQFIKTVKKSNPDFKYLFIPEQHRSKRWHFHALISNCPNLKLIDSGKKAKGMTIYNISPRTFRYGYTNLTKVKDINKLCTYMTKHISKDLINATKGKHRYLASDNLDLPEVKTLLLSQDNLEIEKEIESSSEDILSSKEYTQVGNTITFINIKTKAGS